MAGNRRLQRGRYQEQATRARLAQSRGGATSAGHGKGAEVATAMRSERWVPPADAGPARRKGTARSARCLATGAARSKPGSFWGPTQRSAARRLDALVRVLRAGNSRCEGRDRRPIATCARRTCPRHDPRHGFDRRKTGQGGACQNVGPSIPGRQQGLREAGRSGRRNGQGPAAGHDMPKPCDDAGVTKRPGSSAPWHGPYDAAPGRDLHANALIPGTGPPASGLRSRSRSSSARH